MSLEEAPIFQITGDAISAADLSQYITLPEGFTSLPPDITILEQSNTVDDEGNTVQTFVFVTQQPIAELGGKDGLPMLLQALEAPPPGSPPTDEMATSQIVMATSQIAMPTQQIAMASHQIAMPCHQFAVPTHQIAMSTPQIATPVLVPPPPPVIKPPVGKGPFTCDTCELVFQKYTKFRRHLTTHADDKPYNCTECKAAFNVIENLNLHKAIHVSGDDAPTCPECGKTFHRIASLKAHLMIHEREETLMCPECGDEFGLQAHLKHHMKDHEKTVVEESPRIYPCRKCGEEFNKVALLREHALKHKKIKSSLQHRAYKRNIDRTHFHNECKACGKSFQKPSQLKRHALVHTGERPFTCTLCQRSFNQKGALQTHVAAKHTGAKPHICEFCSATFAQRGNLRAHIQRCHNLSPNSGPLHQCEECCCVFKKVGSLHSHISRFHTNVTDPILQGEDVDDLIQFANDTGHLVGQTLEQVTHDSSDPTSLQQMNDGIDRVASTIDTRWLRDNNSSIGSVALRDTACGTIKKHVVRKVNGIRWHQCNWCSKEFKKPSDLVRHLRIHTHEKPYKCTQCFRSFTVKSTLTAHIKTHTGVKEFNCNVCRRMFATLGSLKVHERLHTGVRPYSCQHCTKAFRTSAHLKHHLETAHLDESVVGEGRKATSRRIDRILAASHTTHLPDVTLQEPILITESGLIQQQSRSIDGSITSDPSVPMMVVSGERPYRCGFCQRCFKKSSHLKQHIRSHTGERPYACLTCRRSFVSNAVLKAHIRTHTGIKSYRCLVCDLTFTTNGSLKRHMTTHSEVRPFMCPYCQKTFKTAVNCKKHMKTHKQELALLKLQEQQQQEQDQQHTHGVDPAMMEPQVIDQSQHIPEMSEVTIEQITNTSDTYDRVNQGLTQVDLTQADIGQATILGEALNFDLQLGQQSFNQVPQYQLPQQYTQSLLTNQTLSQLGLTQLIPTSLDLNSLTTYQPDKTQAPTIEEPEQEEHEQEQEDTNPDDDVQDDNEEAAPINMDEINDPDYQISAASDPSRLYPCYRCPKSFKKASHLKQHIRSHTGEKPYRCELCNDRRFVSLGALKAHLNTHNMNKSYKCPQCHAMFTTNGSLTRHMPVHTDVGPLTCTYDDCNEVFNTQASLRQHHKLHKRSAMSDTIIVIGDKANTTGAETTMNLEATDELEAIEDLTVSEQILIESAVEKNKTVPEKGLVDSSGPRSAHQCDHCPKSFKKPSDLVRHIRTHTGERPYVCVLCARQFTVKSTLDSHMTTHSNIERSFQCHICQALFTTRGSLKVHMRLHTGAKPFACSHCPLRFRTSGHRKSHVMSHFKGSNSARKKRPKLVRSENVPQTIVVQANTQDNVITLQSQPGMANVIPISATGELQTDGQVLTNLEGLQLQFTGNLPQGLQLSTLDPNLIQQPVQIDASILQQLQQQGNFNISINSNFVQADGSGNLIQIQPISLVDNQPIIMQTMEGQLGTPIVQPMVTMSGMNQQVVAMPADGELNQQMMENQVITVSNVDPNQIQEVDGVGYATIQLSAPEEPQTGTHASNVPLQSLPIIINNSSLMNINAQNDNNQPSIGQYVTSSQPMNTQYVNQPIEAQFVTSNQPMNGEYITTNQPMNTQHVNQPIDGQYVASNQPMTVQTLNSNQTIDITSQLQAIQNAQEITIHNLQDPNVQHLQMTNVHNFNQTHNQQLNDQNRQIQQINIIDTSHMTVVSADAGHVTGDGPIGDEEDTQNVIEQLTQSLEPDHENVCYICFRVYKSRDELKEHMSVHVAAAGDIPGQMDETDKGDNPVIDTLQIEDTGPKNSKKSAKTLAYKCATCDKSFHKPSQLERHVRIHTGERPFVCDTCNKAFNQKNALHIHQKKHSGERPYYCLYCNTAFSQKGNLNVHIKRAHHKDMVESMKLPAQSTADTSTSRPVETPAMNMQINPMNINTQMIDTQENAMVKSKDGANMNINITASENALDIEMHELFNNSNNAVKPLLDD